MTKHLHFRTAFFALLLCAGLGAVRGSPTESAQSRGRPTDRGGSERQFFGPLVATGQSPKGEHYTAIRPLWLRQELGGERDAAGQQPAQPTIEHSFLYPLFSYRRSASGAADWSLFKLVNFSRSGAANKNGAQGTEPHSFDLWPVYFSKQTADPATSYRAVFPIGGQIKSRFGYDSLQWVLFPLSFRSEKAGRVTHSLVWPIFKKRSGDGHSGFAVWPLFGLAEKEGDYRNRYFLWPLIYDNARYDAASGDTPSRPTRHSLGVLPFYAREVRPGSISESYLWPFFGYTQQNAPLAPYRETRYFWPLFVQGRGSEHTVNRWAPFYSHSVRRSVDKRWFVWPLFRHETWQGQGLVHTKDQFLFFLYSSERQHSAAQPELPAAHKAHLWPLVSTWDNGAGRSQVQLLSPLSVFFPNNEKIQLLYNPLFALYRRDQQAPGEVRHEVLWRAVTWRRSSGETRELRIFGPTLGLRKNAAGKWRPFLFDFSRKPRTFDAAPETTEAEQPRARPATQATPR